MGVTELLDRLTAADVHLAVRDGQLTFDAPPGGFPHDLREEVIEHRQEIVVALNTERAPPLVAFGRDGCERNGIDEATVAERRATAEEQGMSVAMCGCCAGPSTNGAASLVCRACEPETPELVRELETAPACAKCGQRGYTLAVGTGWLCEDHWRGLRAQEQGDAA